MIERHFDIPFVARLALAEKQIQQNYRPLIAVHKWFARRPGTLFRALILAELGNERVDQTYYRSHNFSDKHILDPFMGGGTTVVEANRLGCKVTAADINPMSWWIVRQEIQDLDLPAYSEAVEELLEYLKKEVGHLFQTTCPRTGKNAEVKYFLWVKQATCGSCWKKHDLFPNHLIAKDARHTANVFCCGHCGTLFEAKNRNNPGCCPECGKGIPLEHTASRNRSKCIHCDSPISYPQGGVPEHRLFGIEYYRPPENPKRRVKGRLFKKPDQEDLAKFEEAQKRLASIRAKYIPNEEIPKGDETDRLHRWGYKKYRELFNARQLLGLELSCRWISKVKNDSVREALATNLSDLLRYQNMLCRYDVMALKSLDIFSVHGYPVGLIQCESNLLGIRGMNGNPVGSGGWVNITEKFRKAKAYCARPFEIRHEGGKKKEIAIENEWIGTSRNGAHPPEEREVRLICGDSTSLEKGAKLDAIFTDPPYFGNVQYAELMDFCYVWLRKLVGSGLTEFTSESTRNAGELTGNVSMGRNIDHFTDGIAKTFRVSSKELKKGSPLAFTYHHNKLEAYAPMAVAILDAKLTCSASLPCPAEMGGSIHINGTKSSIIDTVFICRTTGRVPRKWIVDTPEELADLVKDDMKALAQGGLNISQGDAKCIIYGHLTRLAVWNLRETWDLKLPAIDKIAKVMSWYRKFGGAESVLDLLDLRSMRERQEWTMAGMVRETPTTYDEISF
jgi:adenine-specific DNA methylase